jgi:hypothetical protein
MGPLVLGVTKDIAEFLDGPSVIISIRDVHD